MEFATFLKTTHSYVANVENNKDDKGRRFGRKKENEIIKAADLPPGYFVDGDVENIQVKNEELFYRLFPNAKKKVNYKEAADFIDLIAKIKSGE